MLESLVIRNYALVEHLELSFEAGLNILSGETGAGKSILAGALSLILGARGDSEAIRTGQDEAHVAGVVRLPENPELLAWLDQRGITPEEGTLLIRRVIKRTGRGSASLQSLPVTLADLSELGDFLFDMHSQHEHQTLLKVDNQRRLLDAYGGHTAQREELGRLFEDLSQRHDERRRLETDEEILQQEKDRLEKTVQEIREAELLPGEEGDLENESRRLSQHEALFGAMDGFLRKTLESRGGALALLREARGSLEDIQEIDENLKPLTSRMDNAFFEVEDVAETLREAFDGLEFSPERQNEVEDRLRTIKGLQKKYGAVDIPGLLDVQREASERLTQLENLDQNRDDLEEEIRRREKEISEKAQILSRGRRQTADALEQQITAHLKGLGMAGGLFKIHMEHRLTSEGKPYSGPSGMDKIEFRITSNPGEPPKSLRNVASGGEISRVMLALKTVFAETDNVGTLVFDEIDTGIGGEIARTVGHHLRNLSRTKQVLAITHLATIAAHGDHQLKVVKEVVQGRTLTRVVPVQGEQRVQEIARMLSGDEGAPASLSHAEDLLKRFSSS